MNQITKAINESDEEFEKNAFCNDEIGLTGKQANWIIEQMHSRDRNILKAVKEMIMSTKDEKMFRISEIINRLEEAIKDIK